MKTRIRVDLNHSRVGRTSPHYVAEKRVLWRWVEVDWFYDEQGARNCIDELVNGPTIIEYPKNQSKPCRCCPQ